MDPLNNIPGSNAGKSTQKIIQSQIKIDDWKRILNSNKARNVLLKTGLSDVLRDKFDQNHLDTAEEFQTRFIEEDQLIELLRKEVDTISDLLQQPAENGKTEKEIEDTLKKLEKKVADSVMRIGILKNAFDHFRHRISG